MSKVEMTKVNPWASRVGVDKVYGRWFAMLDGRELVCISGMPEYDDLGSVVKTVTICVGLETESIGRVDEMDRIREAVWDCISNVHGRIVEEGRLRGDF